MNSASDGPIFGLGTTAELESRRRVSDIIQEIRDRMARYPHAEIAHDADSITYYPPSPDGFVVRFQVRRQGGSERYLVYYGASRQQEANRQDSILMFGFGLSNGCRLREFSREGRAYHWITDVDGMRGWTPYWETYSFLVPFWCFWCPTKVQCLQNQLIDLNDSGCGGRCAVA